VQRYIDQFGNPNLAIDELMEFQRNFYAIVADKSTGHGAFEVLVNKATGAVCPEYGPAMMWNTTYGMMGHVMGYQQPSGPMTVSATQAAPIAQRWLAQHQPGLLHATHPEERHSHGDALGQRVQRPGLVSHLARRFQRDERPACVGVGHGQAQGGKSGLH